MTQNPSIESIMQSIELKALHFQVQSCKVEHFLELIEDLRTLQKISLSSDNSNQIQRISKKKLRIF